MSEPYDELLMEWYWKGFSDELFGSSNVMPNNKVLEYAYDIGVAHAQNDAHDNLTLPEILEIIKRGK